MMTGKTMLSAVFVREGLLELQKRPLPAVQKDDEVLLEVEGCGICGTDLHILESPPGHPATPGIILGHEFLGHIRDAGSAVSFVKPGDRVAVAPNLNCGRCRYCKAGLANHCQNFTTLGIFCDGGLARFCVVPERACHPIRQDLPFQEAIWTEVLSCVANSIDNVKPLPGETAVVLGGGPVGALHAQLLLAAGARVIITDVQPARLELLKKIGVHRSVNVWKERIGDVVREEFGWGADIVIDAVGTLLQDCVDLVRVGGRISLFGMNSQAAPAVRQNAITRKELRVFGSYVGVHTFPRAIAILESGVIRPSVLISEIARLQDFKKTLGKLKRGSFMKAVIRHD
jgi:threonine dehydrogenase-like Zn-dependent dehydrogenase